VTRLVWPGGPLPPFRPRFPWRSGDLQTLRNSLVRSDPALPPGRLVPFVMADGDALSGVLYAGSNTGHKPLTVLIHGLTGGADSDSNRRSIASLMGAGFAVLSLNLRGSPATAGQCSGMYHAGRSADLRAVVQQLPDQWVGPGLFLLAYSLGANMLLKYLGEPGADPRILAAMAVCAPFDLSATAQRFLSRRNRIYHNWLLARMKAQVGMLRDPPSANLLARIRTTWEFDELFVAPRNGFAGAEAYYAHCSARNYVADIAVPTLIIHSHDDPWIPIAPYLAFDWSKCAAVTTVFPRSGGHVGFHDRAGDVWFDRLALQALANLAAMSSAA
jgi:uncharacterized protein